MNNLKGLPREITNVQLLIKFRDYLMNGHIDLWVVQGMENTYGSRSVEWSLLDGREENARFPFLMQSRMCRDHLK